MIELLSGCSLRELQSKAKGTTMSNKLDQEKIIRHTTPHYGAEVTK